jgi:hypothetical protein
MSQLCEKLTNVKVFSQHQVNNSIHFSMDPTLYFLTVLGVAILIGLLLSGCSYLIVYHSSFFTHVDFEPNTINLELGDQTQSVNNCGEISS